MVQLDLAEDLKARGLIEHEGGGTLQEILGTPRKVYLGIDPTADSMHVGNLALVLLMRRLSDAGHEAYFLVGGGTGLIGDPKESGERPLLNEQTIESNARALERQLSSLLAKKVTVLNNATWLKPLSAIAFLRDVGKHFSVNQLIRRDIIKRRLETTEESISFTEFSYSLLQAYDFWHLFQTHGVDLQVGGSDQWANIISGIDLIRRKEGKPAYALTAPIIVDKKSGRKFGKSEGNAVWLDPSKTSPFAFYQFWINVADDAVEDYLKIFTLLPLQEIEAVMATHRQSAGERSAQKVLAREVTVLVHGEEEATKAQQQSGAVFAPSAEQDLASLPEDVRVSISTSDLEKGLSLVDLLIQSNLATSKRDARQLISEGAVSLNGEKMTDDQATLTEKSFSDAKAVLKKGKRDVRLICLQ